ncbi:zinc finger and SCAN domain-containing protein 5A-like [Patiria miniata]|uniref:C2H2-type domain-containing protein n=1 Tax=Patiria miniata TaxID=46514 RepID=A0A914B888_PATMI|nr:zinc finger and SCAN domain-containing protein 5A-like [Patiria miniata]
MEVASGSMILHPDLANELRALHESSGFETAGAFLKHLFALEEQHRSQQNLSTDLERLNDFTTNQAISLASAQPPKTASIGVQAKLCSCSDKVIVKTFRGGSAVRKFGLIQRGDLSDKTFDSDDVDQSDSDGVDQSDSDGVDQSGSDYSDTEEMEEEVNYNSRKRKQKSKTVKGKPKHKTVPKKKKQGKDNKESATVSQPKTKRRKPDEGTESVSKPEKKTKKSKDGAKTDGKQTENEEQPNQYMNLKKHSEEISAPLQYQRFVNVDCIEARPYACDLCDKAFRLERSLMIHANIHKHGRQLRYFHCTQCDKGYTNGASLKEHIRTYHEHHGEKLNKCSYCDKCFVRKNALRQHIKIKHKTPEKARSVSFKK